VARLNIDIKDEIYGRLKEAADSEGRSLSDVVRVLVNRWLADKRLEEEYKSYEVREVQNAKRSC